MIKKLHEILLRDVILLDATKSANVLKKYWFVPLWMCRKELEGLAKQVFEAIGNKTINNIQDDLDKLYEYRKLQIYEALYKAFEIETGIKAKIKAWRIILSGDFTESPQLLKVLEAIKKHTGIEIQDKEGFTAFTDFVQHKNDKYNELFPKKEMEVAQEVPLTEVIYSIFNFLGEPLNEDMRLINFISMKKMAYDRIKKQSDTEEDGEQ